MTGFVRENLIGNKQKKTTSKRMNYPDIMNLIEWIPQGSFILLPRFSAINKSLYIYIKVEKQNFEKFCKSIKCRDKIQRETRNEIKVDAGIEKRKCIKGRSHENDVRENRVFSYKLIKEKTEFFLLNCFGDIGISFFLISGNICIVIDIK